MKNKKLFAILTLVCFMFTLMPVAAFAASPAVGAVAVNDVALDEFDQSITVKEGEKVDLEVDAPEAGVTSYYFVIVADGELYDYVNAATFTAEYTFDEAGTYAVYAVADTEVSAFIGDSAMKKAEKWDLIQEKDTLVDDVLTVKVKVDSATDYRIELAYADGTPITPVSTGSTYKYEIDIDANGGWSEDGELVATLIKGAGAGEVVKDADLAFSKAGYVTVVTEEGTTTDRGGEVEFEVVSERTGEYKVIIKYGTKAKTELTVNANAEEVANVAVATAPNAPVDMEQEISAHEFGFKFTDANGKAYDVIDTTEGGNVRVSLTDKPADSNMDNDDFTLVPGEDDGEWYVANVAPAEGFDAEGKYTIKATLKNGKSASITFNAAEMGEVVGIKYDVYNTPRTVAYGESTSVDAVLAYDANGVTRNVADLATFSANGAAVADLDVLLVDVDLDQDGTVDFVTTGSYAWVTAEDDDDFIGKTFTVYAEYEDYVASTTLTVVDQAEGISFPAANAEVGVNTEVTGAIVDSEGNRSAIASYIRGLSGNGLILEKPANAVAVATWDVDSKGNIVLDFLASEEGTYKVQVAVSYNDGTANRLVAGIATIVVGAGEGTFEDVVVMSIGANNIVVNSDVKAIAAAPMIKDGRTFVPFRALAEAFGAEVEWVEATQSVVAELNGVKVVMNIGEKAYTVDGKVLNADVAPFINGASTMVPVRFVAEAFGINVTPIAAADGSVADVLFAK